MSSSVPFFSTTSWHGPSFTVFGSRSRRRFTVGSSFKASSMPVGIFGVASSSISAARSSSVWTPSAMQMRFIEPNRFTATGMSKPVGRSNSNPGPPPGDFDTRSVTALISRSGLTGSVMRASSRSRSSAAMKSLRSLNITLQFPSVPQSATPASAPGVRRRRPPAGRLPPRIALTKSASSRRSGSSRSTGMVPPWMSGRGSFRISR